MWRSDYISSENSKGVHADPEAARILGESTDFSPQALAAVITLRANVAPGTDVEPKPVEGVISTDRRSLEKESNANSLVQVEMLNPFQSALGR